jgi:gamma-glutamyltranspeptidase/glutathione hydrolase
MRRALALALVGAVAAVLGGAPAASARQGSRFHPAVHGRLGVVATESPAASLAGRAVLERGGNAADAAAATVFAIGVARPQSCGIGGGGFAVYRGADGRIDSLDFRETAPTAFTADALAGPGLHKDFTGHLTVGVPGTVAGMDALLARYGTWPLARAIGPGRRLAARGVTVLPSLSAAMDTNAKRLALFPAAAAQYLADGRAYPPGSTLRQPDLARSLAMIQREGPRAFYSGQIARAVIADMATASSRPGDAARMALDDFGRYRAVWRRPLVGSYRGRGIVTVPPPSSGGTTLLELLNILSGYDLAGLGEGSADELHLVAEAEKLAWADRGKYVADPDFVPVPTAGLIAPAYGAQRRALIDPARAQSYTAGDPNGVTPRARARSANGSGDANPSGTTTHVSVVDREGNAVAVTCTIEQEFGSAVVAPGTGFLLNNELTDFGAAGTANQAGPGKRPRSSMAPTIVVRGAQPELVVGGAGGSRIIMGVAWAVLNTVDFGQDVAHAVDSERLDEHPPASGPGNVLTIEQGRLLPGVLDELVRRGHVADRVGEYDARPRIQASGVAPASGLRSATSDSRTDWAALAERPRR